MIVIADTSPVNYLVLIQEADLLPRLFGQVLIPPAVFAELKDPQAPPPVRAWLATAPLWLQVHSLRLHPDPALDYLDAGEREAIALAMELKADQVLMDENGCPQGSRAPQIAVYWNVGHPAQGRPA